MMTKKRWMFVLWHTVTAYLIGCVAMLVVDADGIQGALTGFAFLVGKEFGEFVGKEKAAGTFENDLGGNIQELKEAMGTKWQLVQTVLPFLVAIPALYFTDHLI